MRKIHLVWAEGLRSEELTELRHQVNCAKADPSYTIIANYEVHWTEIKLKDDEVPRIVWANSLSAEDINLLREQVDCALQDPDFPIVTNYEVHVKGIDDLEKVEKEIKPGLRLTRYQILKRED